MTRTTNRAARGRRQDNAFDCGRRPWAALSMLRRLILMAGLVFALGGNAFAEDEEFDFFGEIDETVLVEVPPEPTVWMTTVAPLGLFIFLVAFLVIFRQLVPFDRDTTDINLHEFPTGVKRGIAIAIVLYGVAFTGGAAEIVIQMQYYENAKAYFDAMSLAKLVAFSHAHLFGFTTSFLIIGIPFSLQFNHLRVYQMIFPIGLAAALVDVMSWWGIKYVHANFEYISIICGVLFSLSYLYMLVGLIRVLLFPKVIWASDKDKYERAAALRAEREKT